MNEEWMRVGLCKSLNLSTSLFFADRGRPPDVINSSMRRVCEACIVQSDCLEYAIENNIKDGIWGGTNRRERVTLYRRRIMLDRSA